MDEHHHKTENNSNPQHETRDANVRYLIYSGIAIVVAVIASLLVSWGVLGYFTHHRPLGPPSSPLAKGRPMPPPGMPRLQAAPRKDLDQYLQQQNQVLSSYGWVDRQKGIVRIPIDQAMSLLLKQGLPVRNSKTPKSYIQPGEVQQYTVPEGYMPQN